MRVIFEDVGNGPKIQGRKCCIDNHEYISSTIEVFYSFSERMTLWFRPIALFICVTMDVIFQYQLYIMGHKKHLLRSLLLFCSYLGLKSACLSIAFVARKTFFHESTISFCTILIQFITFLQHVRVLRTVITSME